MLGLTSLEVYNFVSNVTEENKKVDFYTDTFDEFSFQKLKQEVEEILNISDITPPHLQDEIKRPRISQASNKLRLKSEVLMVILYY